MKVEDGNLFILVSIVGKMKYFMLPLEEVELTPEEQLKREIWQLKEEMDSKEQTVICLQKEDNHKS